MELDFDKMNGLVPAIIQDNETRKVLMLGFMNKEAYDKTVETGNFLQPYQKSSLDERRRKRQLPSCGIYQSGL